MIKKFKNLSAYNDFTINLNYNEQFFLSERTLVVDMQHFKSSNITRTSYNEEVFVNECFPKVSTHRGTCLMVFGVSASRGCLPTGSVCL